ncbi:hypothetical protein BGZ68_005602 [Mortierella alpina]|nr:hypothetical protein BGZ68_005602 [Mortierella alpina]
MIVGAGLGGLMMALLLEKANIPYTVFERALEVKPLGALMSLSVNILPVFEQLGLIDELHKLSYPISNMEFFSQNMKKIGAFQVGTKDLPELCDLMLAQVPADKIQFGKKVLSLQQNENGAMLRFADGSTHHGDIIIGADGAYSGVRQSLYKELSVKGELPKADLEGLSLNYLCMLGTSDPMDPVQYPKLKDHSSHLTQIMGDGTSYSWTVITVPGNRMCWSVVQQLPDTAVAKDFMFRNSEWGPEAIEETISDIQDLPNGMGGTMADLINATPRERISKVMLEEKLFETWQHGRTAIIGDACHKMLPSAGQGAVNAMQDAVILANCLYDLESLEPEAISAALKDYQEQRYEHAKFQFEISRNNGKIMSGQSWLDKFIRYVVFNYLPKSIQTRKLIERSLYRPQIAFLPQAKTRGTCPVLDQKPSKRYLKEQQAGKVIS